MIYDERVLSERWAIYEDGARRRAVEAVEDDEGGIHFEEFGEPHRLEPKDSTDVDRMAELHVAFVGSEIEDQEYDRRLPIWEVSKIEPDADVS
jgi:hypothetical protein